MPARRRGFILAAVLVLMLIAPAGAQAFIYWANGNSGSIGRGNNTGTGGTTQSHITGISSPCGVAVNDTHIYWAAQTSGWIGRANLDGTGVNQILIAGADNPCGVALDGSHVYWGQEGAQVGRANLDGTGVNQGFVSAANSTPCGVAVDSNFIYWASFGGPNQSVGRAEITGANPEPLFINGATKPCGVAVNDTHVFWANGDAGAGTTIGRADLDGNNPDQNFIGGLNGPCGIALDDNFIYWGNQASTTIGRATLDGNTVISAFIGGAFGPCGVAVDDLTLPACQGVGASTRLNEPVEVRFNCSGQGTLSYATASTPSDGLLRGLNPAAGTVNYVPVSGFIGQDSFSYHASNKGGPSPAATVSVSILPPRNDFQIGAVTRNRRAGTASVTVEVPGGGELELGGAGLKSETRDTVRAGQVALPLIPIGKARRALRRKGHARIAFEVTFTPLNGSPKSQGGSVKLLKRLRA